MPSKGKADLLITWERTRQLGSPVNLVQGGKVSWKTDGCSLRSGSDGSERNFFLGLGLKEYEWLSDGRQLIVLTYFRNLQ